MNNNLYVISGVAGMTGNELARQLVAREQFVLGFDNFFHQRLIQSKI
jgi:dTDP-glucose 4,6-dehydratase